jgi:hypothetical protein
MDLDVSRARLIVVLGACASGKSYAVRSICKQLFMQGHLKFARVYSKTARVNKEYSWLPEGAVHDIDVKGIAAYQNRLLKWREENDGKQLPMNLLVLDDSYGTIRNPYAPELMSLYSTHRHTNTWVISLLQFATAIPTTLRGICDYAIVFGDRFARSRRAIWNFVGQWYAKEQEFLDMFDAATREKYFCLVFKNNTGSKEEAYTSWRAPADVDTPPWSVKFKVV